MRIFILPAAALLVLAGFAADSRADGLRHGLPGRNFPGHNVGFNRQFQFQRGFAFNRGFAFAPNYGYGQAQAFQFQRGFAYAPCAAPVQTFAPQLNYGYQRSFQFQGGGCGTAAAYQYAPQVQLQRGYGFAAGNCGSAQQAFGYNGCGIAQQTFAAPAPPVLIEETVTVRTFAR